MRIGGVRIDYTSDRDLEVVASGDRIGGLDLDAYRIGARASDTANRISLEPPIRPRNRSQKQKRAP